MHCCRCDHGLGTQGLFGRNPRKSLCVSFFLFSLLFADTQGFVRESCRASKSLCVRPLLIVLLSEPEHTKNCNEFFLTSLRLQNPACQAGLVAHKPSNPYVFFLCMFFFLPNTVRTQVANTMLNAVRGEAVALTAPTPRSFNII